MNKLSVKSGFGIGALVFVAAAVIALPIRTLQYFTVLESETGFYSQPDWSVLLNILLAAAAAAILLFGIIKRKKLDYSLEVTKRPGFGILSLTSAIGILSNAVSCIITIMNTDQFPRIRIGVGEKPNPEYDMADWVLGKIPEEDQKKIFSVIECVNDAIPMILDGRLDDAMGKYNGVKF